MTNTSNNDDKYEEEKKQLLVRTVEGVMPYTDIVVVFTGTVEDGVDNESGFYEHFSKELSVWASERGFECYIDDAIEGYNGLNDLLIEVKKLREVIKKIKECATINAQHDDILEKQEWEYILEVMRCTEETE